MRIQFTYTFIFLNFISIKYDQVKLHAILIFRTVAIFVEFLTYKVLYIKVQAIFIVHILALMVAT